MIKIIYRRKKTQQLKIDQTFNNPSHCIALGAHVKIHVSLLLDQVMVSGQWAIQVFYAGSQN